MTAVVRSGCNVFDLYSGCAPVEYFVGTPTVISEYFTGFQSLPTNARLAP